MLFSMLFIFYLYERARGVRVRKITMANLTHVCKVREKNVVCLSVCNLKLHLQFGSKKAENLHIDTSF